MRDIEIIEDEHFVPVARSMLQDARYSVDISTYIFKLAGSKDGRPLTSLVESLYALAKSNIRIRVLLNIMDKRTGPSKVNVRTAQSLKKHGLEVRYLPDNRCQHSKMLLVDKCVGIIGSHNWTPQSMAYNFETSIAIFHPGYIIPAQKAFDQIWIKAKKI